MASKAEKTANLLNRFTAAKTVTGEGAASAKPLAPVDPVKPVQTTNDTSSSPESTTDVSASVEVSPQQLSNSSPDEELLYVDIDLLVDNPYNARTVYQPEIVKELASSISAAKQIIPIKVVNNKAKPGTYMIIDGHYRKRAFQYLNQPKALVVVHKTQLTDAQMYVMSFMSNNARTAQTAYDNAISWKSLLDNKVFTTKDELANAIQVPNSTISKSLSIFSLPEQAINIIRENPDKFSLRSIYSLYQFFEKTKNLEAMMEMLISLNDAEVAFDLDALVKRKLEAPPRKQRLSSRKHTLSFHDADVGFLKDWGTGRLTLDINLPANQKEEFLQHIASFTKLK